MNLFDAIFANEVTLPAISYSHREITYGALRTETLRMAQLLSNWALPGTGLRSCCMILLSLLGYSSPQFRWGNRHPQHRPRPGPTFHPAQPGSVLPSLSAICNVLLTGAEENCRPDGVAGRAPRIRKWRGRNRQDSRFEGVAGKRNGVRSGILSRPEERPGRADPLHLRQYGRTERRSSSAGGHLLHEQDLLR